MQMTGVPQKLNRAARKIDSLLRSSGFTFERAEQAKHIYVDNHGATAQVDYIAGTTSFGMKIETSAYVEIKQDGVATSVIGQVHPGLLTNTDIRELTGEINHFLWARGQLPSS